MFAARSAYSPFANERPEIAAAISDRDGCLGGAGSNVPSFRHASERGSCRFARAHGSNDRQVK